jgi:hypothetical protein
MGTIKNNMGVLYDFVIKFYKEEIKLAEILDVNKCYKVFVQLEDYCREWLSLFFEDEDIFDKFIEIYLSNSDIKNINEEIKMPNVNEIINMYNKISKQEEFDLLETEYIDKTFYAYADEMVDILYPEIKEIF